MSHRTRLFLILVAAGIVLSVPAIALAQQSAPGAVTLKDFAGTWHWVFQGKSFATMVLEVKPDEVKGSITNASVHTDSDGKITDVRADSGSSPIVKSSFENGILRIVVKDGGDELEWSVRLTSPTTAEIIPAGADAPKMEAIHSEKAQ